MLALAPDRRAAFGREFAQANAWRFANEIENAIDNGCGTSDRIYVTSRRRATNSVRVAPITKLLDRNRVEARLDILGKLREYVLRHDPAGLVRIAAPIGASQDDRPLERAHDITQPDVIRVHGKGVAAARAALGSHQSRPLEVLENLLEEPREESPVAAKCP